MEKILVTGGAGYIGSHTCKILHQSGYHPIVYDNLSTGNKFALQWGDFEYGDIRDQNRLSDVLKMHQPKSIIHFAANAYVGESVRNPAKYYSNNVLGTQILLETMRSLDIRNIVFSSSCATYGIPNSMPVSESTPQNPINPYGRTKLIGEHMLREYVSAYDMSATALRYFNASGADLDGQIGEAHDPETHLIPLILEAVRGTIPPITVFGNDFPTHDGTCVRDYIHVNDLAMAHVLAIKKTKETKGFHFYNLGAQKGFSVMEIIQSVERITGKKVPYIMGGRRDGDPAELIADANKAINELGWNAKFSDIDTVVSSAWKWHQRDR